MGGHGEGVPSEKNRVCRGPVNLMCLGSFSFLYKLNTVPERSMAHGRRQQMRPENETEKQMIFFNHTQTFHTYPN